jgi:hypothetical protein
MTSGEDKIVIPHGKELMEEDPSDDLGISVACRFDMSQIENFHDKRR